MNIERMTVLAALKQFCLTGHGVVIGSPGVGKTRLIVELSDMLDEEGILNLYLPIDQLGNGTEEALREGLGYEGDFWEFLNREHTRLGGNKGILFLDAFDAAREEEIQQQFLNLIEKAVVDLGVSWNVIVTVRTYDAMKSERLLHLFSRTQGKQTDYFDASIRARHFAIPSLSDDELQQALNQVQHLENIYNNSAEMVKQLLRIPFYLWLMVSILEMGETDPDMSKIRSEVQLLNMFWEKKINTLNERVISELVLSQCAHVMVDNHVLSVFPHQIDVRIDPVLLDSVLESLISDEILVRNSLRNRKIAFSHNILFDYAVSVLLVDEDVQCFSQFLLMDPSRVVFLRPSLVYFFTALWYDSPDLFWTFFWRFIEQPDSRINELTRLIPGAVLVQEAREIDELHLLAKWLTSHRRAYAVTVVSHALQAFDVHRDELWSEFFRQIVKRIEPEFVWDVSVTVSQILARAEAVGNSAVVDRCGIVGRDLLQWVWSGRKTNIGQWVDQVGAQWIVPLVAKTYGTDVPTSRELLNPILDLTAEKSFPIPYLYRLTYEMNRILQHDQDFVASVYKVVFMHEELSSDKTHIGGYVLPFTSTRRQDFESCQYSLAQFFPQFVSNSPSVATRTAVECLTSFIYRKHIVPYLKDDENINNYVTTNLRAFMFNNKRVSYLPDHSYIWDSHRSYVEQAMDVANHLFRYLAEVAGEPNASQVLDDILETLLDSAQLAFFWRRLLQVASRNPCVFARKMRDVLLAPEVQSSDETLYEYCEFVKVGFNFLTLEEQVELEDNVMNLASNEENPVRTKLLEHRINQILSVLKVTQLHTEAARTKRRQIEEKGLHVENRPLFSIESSSGPVSDDWWLVQQGVDPTVPAIQKWIELHRVLMAFCDEPSEVNDADIERIIPTMESTFDELKQGHLSDSDKATWKLIWTGFARCAEILSRHVEQLERRQQSWLKQVLMDCATHPEPEFDAEYAENYRSPSWSPSPRTQAAIGLPRVISGNGDVDGLKIMSGLVRDPMPSVRFLAARGLVDLYSNASNFFWESIQTAMKLETNLVVRDALLYSLSHVVHSDMEKTVDVLSKTYLRPASDPVPELALRIISWLAFVKNNAWAMGFYEDMLITTESNISTFGVASLEALRYLHINSRPIPQEALTWLENAIQRVEELIITRRKEKGPTSDISDLYAVINDIVMRLYFSAGEAKDEIPPAFQSSYYWAIKPILTRVTEFARNTEYGALFAPTAHYFMQLLNKMVAYDPIGVLYLARVVAESSAPYGYSLDSMAVREVVSLVEALIADYKADIRSDEGLSHLLKLLDIFAVTGWPDAVRLVWRLEDIYR